MVRLLFVPILLLLTQQTIHAQYGHNWTWKAAPDSVKLRNCVSDMTLLLKATPVPLGGIDGAGEPMTRDAVITFNQKSEGTKVGDPFVFPGNIGYNACKTNKAPYDVTVTACLIVAMEHFSKDEIAIGSDGKINEAGEWKEGITLFRKVFGRDPRFISAEKVASTFEFIKHIDLKPKWESNQLWIVFGLLGVGALAAWYVFNPRPDFTIYFERDGTAYVKGNFPEMYLNAIRTFFKSELPMRRNALVKGWHETGGRFRLGFLGPISDKEQQRIRTFFGMLRARKSEEVGTGG